MATGHAIGPPLMGDATGIQTIAFSPDGKTLALRQLRRHCGVMGRGTPQAGRCAVASRGRVKGVQVESLAFDGDGRILAVGYNDGTIRLWNVAKHLLRGPTIKSSQAAIASLAFNPDGKILASGGYDGSLQEWDVATEQPYGAIGATITPHHRTNRWRAQHRL